MRNYCRILRWIAHDTRVNHTVFKLFLIFRYLICAEKMQVLRNKTCKMGLTLCRVVLYDYVVDGLQPMVNTQKTSPTDTEP